MLCRDSASGPQQVNCQRGNDNGQNDHRSQKDIRAGQEGDGAVIVGHRRRIPKHPGADLRTDDARDQDLGKNPEPLKAAGHMFRRRRLPLSYVLR